MNTVTASRKQLSSRYDSADLRLKSFDPSVSSCCDAGKEVVSVFLPVLGVLVNAIPQYLGLIDVANEPLHWAAENEMQSVVQRLCQSC